MSRARVSKDLKEIAEMNIPDIFIHYDDSNIYNFKFMIIGLKDTPYEGGFYMFNADVPNNYPFSPPKIKFLTTDGVTRCHPNLYACGRVCLSILGTWSGPQWTPALSFKAVILSIQSLLTDNPIVYEPAFIGYKKDHPSSIEYINKACKFNREFAIKEMKKNPVVPEFRDIINRYE